MTPASAAPKHQVPRLMPMTRPRSRAGQVSATSREPSAHSPFSAKATTDRAATKAAKVVHSATTGIISENSAMLIASRLRRPTRSASQGQKKMPAMPMKIATCTPQRHSLRVTPNSLIRIGLARAKMIPSIPSKPQPRPFATAMWTCVRVTWVWSEAFRNASDTR